MEPESSNGSNPDEARQRTFTERRCQTPVAILN